MHLWSCLSKEFSQRELKKLQCNKTKENGMEKNVV